MPHKVALTNLTQQRSDAIVNNMTVTIELPSQIGTVLEAQAAQHGDSVSVYARRVLERTLTLDAETQQKAGRPLKTGRGLLAKYGPAPSAEEIDANRADMVRGCAEDF